jgi:CheY-like chemotaxis protein
VLLVDDEKDVAQSLARLLVLYGHKALAVHSGEAALEAARSYAPDAVLVDIGLPDMDGFELARRLRADYAGRPLQLLALTGYGPNAGRFDAATFDAAAFDAAGFDAHLIKPVSVESLQRLLSAPPLRRVIPP